MVEQVDAEFEMLDEAVRPDRKQCWFVANRVNAPSRPEVRIQRKDHVAEEHWGGSLTQLSANTHDICADANACGRRYNRILRWSPIAALATNVTSRVAKNDLVDFWRPLVFSFGPGKVEVVDSDTKFGG